MSEDKHQSIFSRQMDAIVFIILQIFFARGFENWDHVMCLDQSHSIENICWIITRGNGYFIF